MTSGRMESAAVSSWKAAAWTQQDRRIWSFSATCWTCSAARRKGAWHDATTILPRALATRPAVQRSNAGELPRLSDRVCAADGTSETGQPDRCPAAGVRAEDA